MEKLAPSVPRLPAVAFAALVTATFGGCSVGGSGVIVAEERQAVAFDAVRLSGQASLVLTSGPASLTVVTDDNLQRHVTTRMEGTTLVIDQDDGRGLSVLDPTDGIHITASTPDSLDAIFASGSTSVTWKDSPGARSETVALSASGSSSLDLTLSTTTMSIDADGSGRIKLRARDGVAQSLVARISGSGTLDAAEFPADIIVADVLGSGTAHVNAVRSLRATVEGRGALDYRGMPVVESHVSGSGRVSSAM